MVFTSGCTGALKLLAESFSFSKRPPQHEPAEPRVHSAEERSTETSGSSTQSVETKRSSHSGNQASNVQSDGRSIQGHPETKRSSHSGSRDSDIQPDGQSVEQHSATWVRSGGGDEKTRKSTNKVISFVPLTSAWQSGEKTGVFCYLQDNHTSVQGMRGLAAERCCAVLCVTEQEVLQGLTEDSVVCGRLEDVDKDGNCLFAFPGQSNFSGR